MFHPVCRQGCWSFRLQHLLCLAQHVWNCAFDLTRTPAAAVSCFIRNVEIASSLNTLLLFVFVVACFSIEQTAVSKIELGLSYCVSYDCLLGYHYCSDLLSIFMTPAICSFQRVLRRGGVYHSYHNQRASALPFTLTPSLPVLSSVWRGCLFFLVQYEFNVAPYVYAIWGLVSFMLLSLLLSF